MFVYVKSEKQCSCSQDQECVVHNCSERVEISCSWLMTAQSGDVGWKGWVECGSAMTCNLSKDEKKTAAWIFAQSPKSHKSAGFILSLNDSYCHKAICKPRQDGLAAWRLPKAISWSSQVALTLEFQAIWEPVMFPTKNKVKLSTAISRQLFTEVHIYGTTNERKRHLWRLN